MTLASPEVVDVACPGGEAFIAQMCRGEAAMTRSPGWSKTRRLPRSSLPET